ncbi:hypothetical protein, variant [Allomyces macrogynus ATCC 38327]|nr:hypothetical protein, variant [Allomyces macrogynus ATCC 38327]|eukprot:KNE60034.1 hypothetical protein, variant [Allomyces macrogynus ATCC 38327]
MNMEGGLLAFSGPSERDAVLHAAMATNAWTVYEKNGTPMRSILVEIESGAVLTVRVTPSLALCLISDESIELGILRQKGFTLAAYLEAPLKQIQA